jgi:hypothetical protein
VLANLEKYTNSLIDLIDMQNEEIAELREIIMGFRDSKHSQFFLILRWCQGFLLLFILFRNDANCGETPMESRKRLDFQENQGVLRH